MGNIQKLRKYTNEDELDRLPFRENRASYLARKYGDMWNVFDYRNSPDICKNPYKLSTFIIESNIGKSFAMAFHYYCTKVEKRYQEIFLKEFDNSRRYYNKYYFIDKNGNIQEFIKKKKTKIVFFKSYNYKFEFRHKVTNHLLKDFEEIRETTSNGRYSYNSKLLYYEYGVTPMRLKPLYQRYKAQLSDFKYILLDGFNYEFTSKNDYLYKRLNSERNKLIKKNKKINYNLLKEKQYNMLCDSEMQFKKNKEIDKIKIISHGFDLNTSFRTEKQCNPDLIKNKQ